MYYQLDSIILIFYCENTEGRSMSAAAPGRPNTCGLHSGLHLSPHPSQCTLPSNGTRYRITVPPTFSSSYTRMCVIL